MKLVTATIAAAVVSVACALPLPADAADAAWKPTKNVELVLGAQPGGAHDRAGRVLQKLLTETQALPVSMSVLNRPGQGQSLAVAYVNTHPGDAHYLILLGSSWVTSSIATGSATTHRDFTPIMKLFEGDLVFFVPAESSIRSVRDVVALLKKDPASMSFAFSTSAGNTTHIALAELARIAGGDPKKLRVVVNPSGTITATQVAGNHVNAGVSSSGSAQAMVATGKARLVAALSPHRLPQLPDLPTFREQGYDIVAPTWWMVFGPKGLTPAQVAYWEDIITRTMKQPEAKKFADSNNWTIELTGSKDLPAQLDREHAKLRAMLVDLGMAK